MIKITMENGKEIKVHKITVNGIEVYMTEDHKTILVEN